MGKIHGLITLTFTLLSQWKMLQIKPSQSQSISRIICQCNYTWTLFLDYSCLVSLFTGCALPILPSKLLKNQPVGLDPLETQKGRQRIQLSQQNNPQTTFLEFYKYLDFTHWPQHPLGLNFSLPNL